MDKIDFRKILAYFQIIQTKNKFKTGTSIEDIDVR